MAKGQAAVDWKKPENNAKLFAAVLALFPGTPNYKKIAAVFGPNVPAKTISYRLSVVRKEGQALDLQLGSSSGSTSVKTNGIAKRTAPTAKKNVTKGKGRKRGRVNDDESDDADIAVKNENEEESAGETPTTPKHSAKRQKTMKGSVSKRVSPRKPKKPTYVDPSDSLDNAEDEDAEDENAEDEGAEDEDAEDEDAEDEDAEDEDAEDEDENGSNVSGYEDENDDSEEPSEAGSEETSSGTSWEGPDTSKISFYYMGPNTSGSEEEAV